MELKWCETEKGTTVLLCVSVGVRRSAAQRLQAERWGASDRGVPQVQLLQWQTGGAGTYREGKGVYIVFEIPLTLALQQFLLPTAELGTEKNLQEHPHKPTVVRFWG